MIDREKLSCVENCVAAWYSKSWDDYDSGCMIGDESCGNRLVCFAPPFIKKALIRRKNKAIDKWIDSEVKALHLSKKTVVKS